MRATVSVVGILRSGYMHVARRVCYRPGPVLKRCMHEYNHFILGNRLLRWHQLHTITMQPLAHTLWQRKKREKERKFNINSKNTASSCKQYYYILEYLVFFLEEPSDHKKQKIGGGKLEKLLPLYLVYVSHQGRFGQPRTIWRRGRLQKAATTRDRGVVHMCASSVMSRRATSPAPAWRESSVALTASLNYYLG